MSFPFFYEIRLIFYIVFANNYIKKNKLGKLLNEKSQHKNAGITIVIPCFNEPDILDTLKSLYECTSPRCNVEVIILINHSENSSNNIKSFSEETYNNLQGWIKRMGNKKFLFLPSKPVELPAKWAGAGLARKKGMDEAIVRFNRNNNPDGLIVSLDADTLVEKNYLVEIENHFHKNPQHIGATIAFNHRKEGLEEKHKEGILLYEKFLIYYKNSLAFSGYPYALFTIGSAFAVKADAYVKRGGMTRRKAGEDFYFLQNLVQQGEVGEITSTMVFPSARLSDRVPFGTGPILKKWLKGEEDLTRTFNFQAFLDLKEFFSKKEKLFKIMESEFTDFLKGLPMPVSSFLKEDLFYNQIEELNKNCSTCRIFIQRFFQIFNAFKILKFLNYTHSRFYKKADLEEQNITLINMKKKDTHR